MDLTGSYNYWLVALSVLIAILASYAALNLAGRLAAAAGWTRAVWLLGGAGAMGTGIWSMHYIGMLAFILPVPVAYHWPTVLLSLFAAILASVIALSVVSRQKMSAFRAFGGSVLMGAGIAGMHYIGMDAMRLPAMCHFDSFLVILSVVFALLISLAALWITFHLRVEKARIGPRKLAGAVVMGAAIPVMHYTGMAAASFTPSDMPVDLSNAVSISTLGAAGIAAATLVVLGLALLTSWVDKRFTAQALELQEEKLQQSEAYLSEAQRLSHTGSFGWKVPTGETLWSEETFRIFQYDRASKPTMELLLQRVHPEDAALVERTIDRASQDGKDFDFEHRLMMPDGSVKYVHVVTHAVRDESGKLEFVGALMDVTERKQAEEALRERAHLLDLTHDTVFVRDVNDVITYWNRGAEELYGWTREEAVGKVSHHLTQTIFPAPLEEINADLLRAGRWEGELTHTKRDGTQVVVASRWSLQRDEQGLVAAILETNNDITERKRTEEELRASERNLRLLIEVIPGMVCLGSPEGEIEYVNQRVLDYTGKTLDDLARFGWTGVLHPDDAESVLKSWLQSMRTGQMHEVEYRLRRPDGTYRWIQSRADPMRDGEGRIINWYGLLYDIEDRKNAEEALRRTQVELAHVTRVMTMGELTASIAHEIKQPLAAVVTNGGVCLRWLATAPPNVDEARESARRIIRDGNRANDVITRIRALVRKTETPKARLDINEAIKEVVLLTQNEAARKGVTLRLELTAGLPPIFGDRVQLQQVALNLLMNGIEAMASVNDRPRELLICSRTNESGQVFVAVQDCGEGIDRENLEKIFSAFYTTKSQGMGMGLAISRSIVENHGGRLWAVPNDGPGATFQFTLLPHQSTADSARGD